jgi:hypothetical protein
MPKLWGIVAVLAAACGGDNHDTVDAAPTIDAAIDAGGFVEAPHGTTPQVVTLGGPVMTAPKIVPVFFAGDTTMQPQVEAFLAMLPGSSYWHATTSEYGVGDVSVGTTIVTSDTPPTTDTALESWLAANLDGTHAGWTYDPNVIYSVYLPAGVVLQTQFGTSCQAFGAYHSETSNASGKITYALMPRCGGSVGSLTAASSHEFIEAVTDPLPFTMGAFQDMDPEHAVWGLTPGAEIGDMCEYVATAYMTFGSFRVQRTWSNAAAAAGHDPCVPAPTTPYQGAAPMLVEDLTVTGGEDTPVATKGVQVPLSTSKTIDVVLFSDAETADFTVHATDASAISGGAAELMFAWDKTTGHNGDTLHLTITRKTAGQGGSEFLVAVGQPGMSTSLWWGLVGNGN